MTAAPSSLVLIAGHAGVGKSTVARALCSLTGWPLVDKDTVTGPLVEALMETLTGDRTDRSSIEYATIARPAEYEAFTATALQIAATSTTTVAVAPFVAQLADPDWLTEFEKTAEQTDIALAGLWVHCDPDTHGGRIIDRQSPRDADKIPALAGWLAGLSTPPWPEWMTEFDNTKPRDTADLAAAVHVAIDAVRSQP